MKRKDSREGIKNLYCLFKILSKYSLYSAEIIEIDVFKDLKICIKCNGLSFVLDLFLFIPFFELCISLITPQIRIIKLNPHAIDPAFVAFIDPSLIRELIASYKSIELGIIIPSLAIFFTILHFFTTLHTQPPLFSSLKLNEFFRLFSFYHAPFQTLFLLLKKDFQEKYLYF